VWSRLPCQQQLNTDESVVSQVPDARVWEKAGCYSQAWRTENRSKIPIRRGRQKLMDTGGRVERFQRRIAKGRLHSAQSRSAQ